MTIRNVASSTAANMAPIVEKSAKNILFRIQALVGKINAQLSRLSEETTSRSQTMKKEYRISSAKAADLQYKQGSMAPVISGLSLLSLAVGAAASQVLKTNQESIQSVCNTISNQIPSFGQWYSGSLGSQQMREQSISQLRQTEISNEGQKSGEARDFQSELQQIVAALRDLYKKASG